MSQFNFQQNTAPLDAARVILTRIKTAMSYTNAQGQPVQTHYGMVDVVPLAKVAYHWGIQLPPALIESTRKNQYEAGPVIELVHAVEAYLYNVHGIPPFQPGMGGNAEHTSRAAHFGPLTPESQAAQAQHQATMSHPPQAMQAPAQQPYTPPLQAQQAAAQQIDQVSMPAYQPPDPALPPQQAPAGSPLQGVVPPQVAPVNPYQQMGLQDPVAPAPVQQTPAEQMGLQPPSPFTPPLGQATYEQLNPPQLSSPDAMHGIDTSPDNTPSGKDEAQTVSGFNPEAFAAAQSQGLNPHAPNLQVGEFAPSETVSDTGGYSLMNTLQIDSALSQRQIPVDPTFTKTQKVSQLVGWDSKMASQIV